MKRVGTALLFLLLVSCAWAQTIGGTFNSQPTQASAVVAGPLLTPPIVSLGAGINGPVVINGQTAVVSAPQTTNPAAYVSPNEANTSYPGYISGGGYVPMPAVVTVPTGPAAPGEGAQPPMVSRRRFDYVVAPSAGAISGMEPAGGSVGDTSLGEIASSLRKGPPLAQRKFTNDDIARINGMTNKNYKMPGSSTEQPLYPQQQPQQQQAQPPHSGLNNAPLPPGAKPSPFSPHPVPQTPESSTSAAADPN